MHGFPQILLNLKTDKYSKNKSIYIRSLCSLAGLTGGGGLRIGISPIYPNRHASAGSIRQQRRSNQIEVCKRSRTFTVLPPQSAAAVRMLIPLRGASPPPPPSTAVGRCSLVVACLRVRRPRRPSAEKSGNVAEVQGDEERSMEMQETR